jgi:hypothetical protein
MVNIAIHKLRFWRIEVSDRDVPIVEFGQIGSDILSNHLGMRVKLNLTLDLSPEEASQRLIDGGFNNQEL